MPSTDVDILLVEDTRSDAEMTIRAIRKSNIKNIIVHVQDGKEALDFLFGTGAYADRDITQKPRVILLDLKMPKVDGFQVLEKIKANVQTKKIPVVILTSSKEHPDVEKCYSLGVNSFIVKPVGSEDFTAAISALGLYWMIHNQSPS